MPFGFGDKGGGGSSPYMDVEQAPLSAQDDDDDDDDDDIPLPPYSDTPPSKRSGSLINEGDDNGHNNTPTNGSSAHKAISIEDETSFLRRNDNSINGKGDGGSGHGYHDNVDEYNNDNYGDGDYYSSSATPSKNRRSSNSTTRYRGGLICAYLKYWMTCQCCNCCGGSSSSASRNIGGPDMDPRKCSRGATRALRILFYMFLLMIIILCASSIGYIIAQDGSPFASEDSLNTNNNNNNGSSSSSNNNENNKKDNIQGTLPPPPEGLHKLCTDWITESGRTKCQELCNVAQCCSLAATDKNSCWEDQASDCATYRSACMALELAQQEGVYTGEGLSSKITLKAPKPSYLNQICSASSLQTPTGFDECAVECRPSRCCDSEMYGCEVVEGAQYCDAYGEPCAGVAESWRWSGHAQEVVLKCNEANLNPPDECIEACHGGACCYVSDEYPPIEQLFDNFYGSSENPMKSESCSSNTGFCQQYGACEHLNYLKDVSGWHEDTITYELDISSVCKAEYIAQFGALECSNVCQPAHCCFSGGYRCDDVQLGHLNCQSYNECAVLYPNYKTTEELFEMAKQIDEICASNRRDCWELCKERMCCFDDGSDGVDNNCANDSSKNCLAYAGCETLAFPEEQSTSTTTTATTTSTAKDLDEEVDEFITALESACSATSLTTLEGIQQCHYKCQTHLCCFNNDVTLLGNDCSNVHVDACNAYKPCERLVAPTTQNPLISSSKQNLSYISDAVDQACDLPLDPSLVNADWITSCHGVCASRLCCLVDSRIGSSCQETLGTEECDAYAPCSILLNDSGKEITDVKQIVENEIPSINDVCTSAVSTDSSSYDNCRERCNERSCCFEDQPQYSCYKMEQSWCDEYESCSFVYLDFLDFYDDFDDDDDDDVEDPVDNTQSFNTLCTESSIQQNRDVCKSHCSRFECCFKKDDSISCYEENRQECEEYYICEVFYTGENMYIIGNATATDDNSQDASDDNRAPKSQPQVASDPQESADAESGSSIRKACSSDSLKTLEGIEQCFNKCQAHLCCVPTDVLTMEFDCSDTYPDECNSYYICENLVDQYRLWKPPSDKFAAKTAVQDACNFPSDIAQASEEQISKCHEVCEARMCCLAHESLGSNCVEVLGEDECSQYSPCQALIGGKARNSNSIEEVCDHSKRAYPCEKKCKERSCCFETEAEYSCYAMEKDWCDEYERCSLIGLKFLGNDSVSEGKLNTLGPTSTTALPPEDEGNDDDDGYDEDEGDEEDEEEGNTELAVFKIICSTSDIDQNKDICKEKCSPYSCCFDDGSSSCYDEKKKECDDHYICNQFFTNDDQLAEVITDDDLESMKTIQMIEDVCDHHLPISPCKKKCNERSCCFDDEEESSCYEMDKEWCDEYEQCSLVGLTFTSISTITVPTSVTNNANGAGITTTAADASSISSDAISNSGQATQSIEDVCDHHLPISPCKKKCNERLCCFEGETEQSCYGKDKEWCDEYEQCSLVGLTFASEEDDLIIQNICSEEQLEVNEEPCNIACVPYECCFTTDGACSPSINKDCVAYEPCRLYFSTFFRSDELADDIGLDDNELLMLTKACNLGKVRVDDTECKMLCKGSKCCFDEGDYSCMKEKEIFCDDHTICSSVFT